MAEKGYKKTKWSGLDNFECEHCPFSTLDEDEMKDHQRTHPETSGGTRASGGGDST